MSDNVTGFRVDANINPFEQAMRRLVDAAKTGELGVGSALGGLAGGPLAGLKNAFAGIAAVLSGGFMTVAIRDTAAMTESSMDLSRALGITTNEAKAVQMAMQDIGAKAGEYEGAAKGMTRQLKENEDAMNQMGLVTRDAAGNLRPLNDLVLDGIQVLGTYKEGTDRTMAGQVLFGRVVDASGKIMLYTAEVMQENQRAMQELGLEVGENAVAAWGEYDSAMDRAGFGMQGLGKAIGDTLMPVMVTLVEMFNAVVPAAIAVTRIALGSLSAVFLTVKLLVVEMAEVASLALYAVAEPIRGIAESLFKLVTGDFAGASAAFNAIGQNMSAAWQNSMNRIGAASSQTVSKIKNIFSEDTAPGSGGGLGPGTKNFVKPKDKATKDKATKEPSQMPIFEGELAERIAEFEKAAQAEGTLRQYSKTEEAAYWKEVSTRAGISAEDKARAEKKWRDLERGLRSEAFAVEMADLEQRKQASENNFAQRITLAEQAHAKTVAMYGADSKEAAAAMGKVLEEKRKQVQQIQQLEDMANQRRREKALGDVEFDRMDAEHKVAMGLMTQEQLLIQQQQFEERMHAIKLQYLQLANDSVDPQKDPVKAAEINAQIEQLEQQHKIRMGQIANQTMQANTAEMRGLFGGIQASYGNTIKGMMTGTMTLAQGIKGLFRGVVDAVAGMLAQMVAKWVLQQIMMKVFGKVTGLSTVATEAAKAGAGGVASMAAAPFPMNLSAPAFGAAMSAAALAFSPVVASASRGFDIPRGLNPLTQLHQEEMVLPSRYANVIRGMADGEGSASAVAAAAPVVHFNVQALDGASVKRVLMANQGALVESIAKAYRNGHRP